MKKFILSIVTTLVATVSFSQNVPSSIFGDQLPTSWEAPFPNGKIVCTLHTNGNITSQSLSGCMLCGGMGLCGVCGGTGGQYWYGMGIQPCGRCIGTGRCATCNGKGYTVINSTTYASGLTIGYDNNGNYYVVGPGESERNSGGRSSSSNSTWYECPCSDCPTFGRTTYHKCKNCGETHQMGSHLCKRR